MSFKSVSIIAAFVALGAGSAFAAPMNGKVAAVQKPVVRVVVKGKLEAWVKKGAPVRFLGVRGSIVGVAADTLSISTPRAEKAKVGDAVVIDKPRASGAGC